MSWNAAQQALDLNNRPNFITAGRNNMLHPVAMLHHRVPWNVLGTALNAVLSGGVDAKLINSLLKLSPVNSKPLVDNFKAALTQLQAGKTLSQANIAAIEAVEQEVFSLPCNLFLGLNARADDPGNEMDFTPDDVNFDGTVPTTAAGELEKLREKVMGLLSKSPQIDLTVLDPACTQWATQWKSFIDGGLSSASPFQAAHWAPGAPPFTAPAFRRWVNGVTPLSVTQSQQLNQIVQTRAITKLGA